MQLSRVGDLQKTMSEMEREETIKLRLHHVAIRLLIIEVLIKPRPHNVAARV